MSVTIGFGIVAAIVFLSAIFVVRTKNLIHAVLMLGITLIGTAALYAMLGASFLAGVQVLVYVGGVITLMIFGVMITRRHEGIVIAAESTGSLRAAIVAAALFGVVAAAVRGTPELDAAPPAEIAAVTASDLGRGLLREHVLAFEVVSFLLLGAIIGAIVVARRRDPGADPKPAKKVAREPKVEATP